MFKTRRNPDGSLTVGIIEDEPEAIKPKAEPKTEKPKTAPKKSTKKTN